MNTVRILFWPLPASVARHWVVLRSFLLTPIVLFAVSVPIVLAGNDERSDPAEALFVFFVVLHAGWYVGGALAHVFLSWLNRRHWWHYAITGFLLAAALPLFLIILPSLSLQLGNPEASALQLVIAAVSICTFCGAIGVASVSVFWWLARASLQNAH